jgi:hypothetical protein
MYSILVLSLYMYFYFIPMNTLQGRYYFTNIPTLLMRRELKKFA